jgi:protein-disulfide isomerase
MQANRPPAPSRSSAVLLVLSLLALAEVGVSIAQSHHFYALRAGTGGFKSYCNMGAGMNCDAVAASSWAELLFGIPLSSFAAGWALALFLLTLMARAGEWRRYVSRALVAMSAFGALLSLFYLVVMVSVLKTLCLMCLVVDGLNVAIFTLALVGLKPWAEPLQGEERSQWKLVAGITAAAMFLAVVGLKGLDPAGDRAESVADMANSVLSSPVLAVGAGPEFPSIGPAGAKVTIVEFSDFQCPYCRLAAVTLHSVLARYPDKVRVVFRNFPLDASCNREMQRPLHQHACDAARVAWCAHQQGKFEPVYEELFEHQTSLGPGKSFELARGAGADPSKLEACVASSEASTAIVRDVEEGIMLKIESTPTLFVNGHRVQGALPLDAWVKIIDSL